MATAMVLTARPIAALAMASHVSMLTLPSGTSR
jgi:hypothetical protein